MDKIRQVNQVLERARRLHANAPPKLALEHLEALAEKLCILHDIGPQSPHGKLLQHVVLRDPRDEFYQSTMRRIMRQQFPQAPQKNHR